MGDGPQATGHGPRATSRSWARNRGRSGDSWNTEGVPATSTGDWQPAIFVAAVFGGMTIIAAQAPIERRFFDGTDHPAIAYATTPADDPVQRLERDLESGTRRLTPDPTTGYLKSVLRLLDVPESSQLAVFSKTSLQA